MKTEVLVFISDEYADWEAAYASFALNDPSTEYTVKTLALTGGPVKSLGGFTVIPDYTMDNIPDTFAMLILVGGMAWEKGINEPVKPLVDRCVREHIPVAAICAACTFLAEGGYLDHVRHTGNSPAEFKEHAPHYHGEALFVEKQAVADGGLITANGSAAVEITIEILRILHVVTEEELQEFHQIFKIGDYPQ